MEQAYLVSSLEKRQVAVDGILGEGSDVTWAIAKAVLEKDAGGRLEAS